MQNICRPFVLYNDFLPPGSEIHETWDYLAFGYYDGLSVGENLFSQNDCSFNRLWDYEKKQLKNLKGKYSEKILFGFRNEYQTDPPRSRDSEFWIQAKKEATAYPFIFLTLLQVKTTSPEMNLQNRRNLEDALSSPGNMQAISYLTLDSSDIILILMCKRYRDGAGILDRFHREEENSPLKTCGLNLSYSFTIAAIQRHQLNYNIESLASSQKENLHKAYIYIIERKPGSIDYVREEIGQQMTELTAEDKKNHLRKESVLGCNDEVIVIEDVPWISFLRLFQDLTGVLNNSSAIYQENLVGATTIIALPQEPCIRKTDSQDNKEDGKNITGQVPLLSEKLRKMIGQLNSGNLRQFEDLNRYLYQITNSLQKFEKSAFPDYILISAFLPLNMVMKIAENRDKKTEARFFDSFYEFIKGLNVYVQNATHSDRQFTQTLNFDIKIYCAPVKITAFYNAFIYRLKRHLSDSCTDEIKHTYEFLTCLGVADNLKVLELFKNVVDTQRLFLVNIPEHQAYNPKQMLVMLAHEVGHFVGQTVRDRERRLKHARIIMAKMLVVYFRDFLRQEITDENEWQSLQTDAFLTELEKSLRKQIEVYLNKLEDREYLTTVKFVGINSEEDVTDFLRKYKKYKTYSHLLTVTLTDSCVSILEEQQELLFGYLLEKDFLYWLEREPSLADYIKRKREHGFLKAGIELARTSAWNRNELSMASISRDMMYLFKECVADLISIWTLKLSMYDYLQVLMQNAEDQGRAALDVLNYLRSSMIVFCMSYRKTNPKSPDAEACLWSFNKLEDDVINHESRPPQKILIAETIIYHIIDQYLTKRTNPSNIQSDAIMEFENQFAASRYRVFRDTEVLMEFEKYLLASRDNLASYDNSEDQQSIRKIYQLFQEENAENMVIEIQKYIAEYHKCLQAEIQNQANII